MKRLIPMLLAFAIVGESRADFYYPDFSDSTGLKLNNHAHVESNRLKLTRDEAWSSGSAFTTNQVALGAGSTFSTYFQFQMYGSGGISDEDGQGADGLVFVVQTIANNVGGAGGGIGYEGIGRSVGIEFDTYHNLQDPSGNHVGVDANGSLTSLATALEPTRFNNGEIWNVWIDYDGSKQRLDVYWSMLDVRPAASMLSQNLDIASILGANSGFVGFTSATGAAWDNHDILNWRFSQTLGAGTVPEPASVVMLGLGAAASLASARNARPR